jgi:hypothetical protein
LCLDKTVYAKRIPKNKTVGHLVDVVIEIFRDCIRGVSGEIVNILGGGSMDYSE